MNDLYMRWARALHHKRLSESTAAIAGLAGAVSVFVGYLAARAAPKGLHKFIFVLHLAKKPTLLKLAPIVAGIAVAITTAAGLLHFYTWWVERKSVSYVDNE